LGLKSVLPKKVKTFSGGMKRRLNIAIGVINKPRILFLDEPTVGVDVQSKNAILSFLNRINNEGTTIIYTSHHLEEAEKLCSRIAILDYGKLVALDKTKDLLEKYKAESLNQLLLELTGKEFRDNV
jgi:ABC-2 type transport system ATP-binding protein